MIRTELLAPAGDMACLKAAIAAGADAIYLGGQRFGARAFAGNFKDEELLEALQFAHFFQKKIYLTVNTLTKEEELAELTDWLRPFYEAGLDGVIVQDPGVLERCRRAFPDMELHASTQMTVTESETALFLKECGVSRVVPARELSLEELVRMKEETGLELEVFIHGALCYSYSGQCLFSSLLGGRSGNRGRCAQPCRLPYTVSAGEEQGGKKKGGQKEQYPLSLKDLCVLPMLPCLLEAGIDSFKIEGRMKSPEYVAGVTAMYRKYMDLYEQNPDGWQVEEKDLAFLSNLYVRSELSSGYYKQHNGKELVTLQKPGYAGASEAVLEEIRDRYLKRELTQTVNMTAAAKCGEPFWILAECNGVQAEVKGMTVMPAQKKPLTKADLEKQLRKTGGSVFAVGKTEICLEDSVFLPVSAINELRRQALELLLLKMTERYRRDGRSTRASAAQSGQAENLPDRGETSVGQIFAGTESDSDKSNAAIALPDSLAESGEGKSGAGTALYISALYPEQAIEGMGQDCVKRVYLAAEALTEQKDAVILWDAVRKRKEKDSGFTFYLVLPVVQRAYSADWFQKLMERICAAETTELVDGLMACSMSGILWARRRGFSKPISLQHSVYVFNREAWAFFMRHFKPDTYTAPLELNRKEVKQLPTQNMEVMVYGRIPMMHSAGCVKKTQGLCRRPGDFKTLSAVGGKRSMLFLKDRYRAEFPVLISCQHCMNTIYNSVPLSLHQYMEEIKGLGVRAVRLDFTDESVKDVQRLIRFFGKGEGEAPAAYTTGHYKKGVQ